MIYTAMVYDELAQRDKRCMEDDYVAISGNAVEEIQLLQVKTWWSMVSATIFREDATIPPGVATM